MGNPWLKKNPFLSLWLSGANAMAGAARGRARSTTRRHAAAAARQMTKTVVNAWLTLLLPTSLNPEQEAELNV
jgi:hypothetical protein